MWAKRLQFHVRVFEKLKARRKVEKKLIYEDSLDKLINAIYLLCIRIYIYIKEKINDISIVGFPVKYGLLGV